MKEFYCSVWNAEEETLEEGPHGQVEEIILGDAYFVAHEISTHMPDDQYVGERDVEMVSFTIDTSGDEITADDVSSKSSDYLGKFPGVYQGVAGYVQNLERVPAERFKCPECGNYLASEEQLEEFN